MVLRIAFDLVRKNMHRPQLRNIFPNMLSDAASSAVAQHFGNDSSHESSGVGDFVSDAVLGHSDDSINSLSLLKCATVGTAMEFLRSNYCAASKILYDKLGVNVNSSIPGSVVSQLAITGAAGLSAVALDTGAESLVVGTDFLPVATDVSHAASIAGAYAAQTFAAAAWVDGIERKRGESLDYIITGEVPAGQTR